MAQLIPLNLPLLCMNFNDGEHPIVNTLGTTHPTFTVINEVGITIEFNDGEEVGCRGILAWQ